MTYASPEGVLNAQWNAAQEQAIAARQSCAPHVLMAPRVFPDGTMWCALLGENLQEGVSGFGATPEAACAEFDKAWTSGLTPQATRQAREGSQVQTARIQPRQLLDHSS